MLRPKKKITKKELKQDALVTTYANITSWYYANKKIIGYAVTALVVILIAGYAYWRNHLDNNEKAATALGKILAVYDAAASDSRQYKFAIEGQPESGVMGLKDIVENYGGTESGELARFYLANAYYYTGQIDLAIEEFNDFSGGDEFIQASAYAGLAACYEAKEIYDKAALAYEKASNIVNNVSQASEYLVSAARCYGLSGSKDKAIALLKRVKKEYPNSPAAREVDRYIARFSA